MMLSLLMHQIISYADDEILNDSMMQIITMIEKYNV